MLTEVDIPPAQYLPRHALQQMRCSNLSPRKTSRNIISLRSPFAATSHPKKLSRCTCGAVWSLSSKPLYLSTTTKNSRGFISLRVPLCMPLCAPLLGHLKRTGLASTTSRLTFDELAWNAASPLVKATVNDTRHVFQFLGHGGEVGVCPNRYLSRCQD